jgi:phosphoglucosamine mutase
MTQLFGTDGIRGRAGDPPLDPATIQRIGRAVVRAVGISRPRVLIGRDTRESSAGIESHVAAGLLAEGADVVSTGVLPTPAVAHLTRLLGFDLGVVISASHNPYEDNGIKVFGGGRKFTTELEEKTEAIFDTLPSRAAPPAEVPLEDLSARYLEHLRRALPAASLKGVHLVADCANGATSFLARALFEALGARVEIRHDAPDGRNINQHCGATVPEAVAAEVVRFGAHLGVAFDGDGDRAIFADSAGRIIDGDHVLFLAARHLHAQGRLRGDCVVATVMSNLGLEHALGRLGIGLVRTSVGDRHVLDEMIRRGANVGGEQSGHVIFLDHEPTGDGLLTALQILGVVLASGRSLGDLARDLPVYPQVHRNVRVREKADLDRIANVRAALDTARKILDGRGRLLVRYSGTEPVLRVMAEGPDEGEIRRVAESIAAAATEAIGVASAGERRLS